MSDAQRRAFAANNAVLSNVPLDYYADAFKLRVPNYDGRVFTTLSKPVTQSADDAAVPNGVVIGSTRSPYFYVFPVANDNFAGAHR